MSVSISEALPRLARRLSARLPENLFPVIVAAVVGVVAGLGAYVLHKLIDLIAGLFTGDINPDASNILLLVLPIIGITLCGVFCRYVVKDDLEFGTEKITADLKRGRYLLKPHLCFTQILACSLTLGFGASAGSEGPIAYAGAGIGSNVGRVLGLDPKMLRLMVICGAAAGIAGIFTAPMGGFFFAIEVLAVELSTASVVAIAVSCIAASSVAYSCAGFALDIPYDASIGFDYAKVPALLLLGLAAGLYSLYYSCFIAKTERFFNRVTNPWVKNLTSGVLIGALVFLFPVLRGEGYGVLGQIINGDNGGILTGSLLSGESTPWVIMVFLAGVVAVKAIATSATNSGGGVGGDFAPTLFAGCFVGLLFAMLSNTYLGTHLSEAQFALCGMAAVMAGCVQAPIMAMFITVEMTGDFNMFFPLAIVSAVSYLVVRFSHRHLGLKARPSWIHRGLESVRRYL